MNLIQYLIKQFRPRFWHAGISAHDDRILFNYRKYWFVSVSVRALVSLIPMCVLLIFSYVLENKAIKNENDLLIVRLTSNTSRSISYFLEERLDALKFITQQNRIDRIANSAELPHLLHNLKMGFGGFVDLGLIDPNGVQINYTGPFDLKGKNYQNQDWFIKCIQTGSYVSDVFLGYRKLPHMVIAKKWPVQNESFYILRATLDIQKVITILSSLELREKSDAFICNRKGLLQTPSKYYGKILQQIDLPIPDYSPDPQVLEAVDKEGNPIFIGYDYIDNSPYILMLVKRSKEIMKGWYSIRQEINWFFGISGIITLIIVLGISTVMVNRIYEADQTRLKALERLESSSRLISVGRLAAGIAHEINNPLAVISENVGLIKDLFTIEKEYMGDKRLMDLIDAALESVERGGEITKQLLSFARPLKIEIKPLRLNMIIEDVLTFFGKEASYRNIIINIDIPEDLPIIHSDRGSVHQILFNIINNAFHAMEEGGDLDIIVKKRDDESITVSIRDTGYGISEEDQQEIFEPFFTIRQQKGGTGLGLFITHGLVRKLRGDLSLSSKVDEGTTFSITFPIRPEGDIQNENSPGG